MIKETFWPLSFDCAPKKTENGAPAKGHPLPPPLISILQYNPYLQIFATHSAESCFHDTLQPHIILFHKNVFFLLISIWILFR